MDRENARVLMGISGGQDSAVAAALLRTQGYDVVGLHLIFPSAEQEDRVGFHGVCNSESRLKQAETICKTLDIPLHTTEVSSRFNYLVEDYFVQEYLALRVPHPCVPCSTDIKFHALFEKAKEFTCDTIATGHYAHIRIDAHEDVARLMQPSDVERDQSYLLYRLQPQQLKQILMPLGGLTQKMIKRLALQFDLQYEDILPCSEPCFIRNELKAKYIKERIAKDLVHPGVIKNTDGVMVGDHTGMYKYSFGQDTRIPIRDEKQTYFVVGFDLETNTLWVGEDKQLLKEWVLVEDINWLVPLEGLRGVESDIRVSMTGDLIPSRITQFEVNRAQVSFNKPLRAPIPGQPLVFYRNGEVLGGGTIKSTQALKIDLGALKR